MGEASVLKEPALSMHEASVMGDPATLITCLKTLAMGLVLEFIEQPEVIKLPVPGKYLRADLFAAAAQEGTHRQAADEEDTHAAPALVNPSPPPAGIQGSANPHEQ